LFWLSTAGCDAPLPGTLVGESAHFRLFLDPALDPQTLAYWQSHDGLTALETDFADKRTMLKTPDGEKIDYHLLTPANIASVCGFPEFDQNDLGSGCAVNDQHAIAAGYIPHQHELMHAYMRLVLPDALPIPFLVEGVAQALGCGTQVGTSLTDDVPSWEEATMEDATDPAEEVYTQGGLFSRYLIRTQGMDAYLRYYAQAPARRDPALFAANFSAFWNMNIDDVWSAMHTLGPYGATTDGSICPCSLATLPTDGQLVTSDPLGQPYWTLPDTYGSSLALTTPTVENLILADCEGVTPQITSFSPGVAPGSTVYADGNVTIADLPDTRPRYALAPISRASVGHYLADDCATADAYALPSDFLLQPGYVFVITNQLTTSLFSKFLQLQIPSDTEVSVGQSDGLCATCPFDPNTCVAPTTQTLGFMQSLAAGSTSFEFLFWPLPTGTAVPTQVHDALQFSN
jgi:hypothetical protein